MESARLLARVAVDALDLEDRFDLHCRYMRELSEQYPREVAREALCAAGLPLVLLRKASEAAAAGESEAQERYMVRARQYVDDDELTALIEEHRLSFSRQFEPMGSMSRERASAGIGWGNTR